MTEPSLNDFTSDTDNLEGQEVKEPEDDISRNESQFVREVSVDKLGRPHIIIPHTGTATICLRAAKFHKSTSEVHANVMKPILEQLVKKGKTAALLIADGGPDWSTASVTNAMSFMRLWRDCNLDLMII